MEFAQKHECDFLVTYINQNIKYTGDLESEKQGSNESTDPERLEQVSTESKDGDKEQVSSEAKD